MKVRLLDVLLECPGALLVRGHGLLQGVAIVLFGDHLGDIEEIFKLRRDAFDPLVNRRCYD